MFLTLLPVFWVVLTPFAFAALVAGSPAVSRGAARHLPLVLAAGWLGVAMIIAGAFLVAGPTGRIVLLAGAPLAGLSFWSRAGDDSGGGDDDRDDDTEPPPDLDGVDWDRFLRDLDRWERHRERARIPA